MYTYTLYISGYRNNIFKTEWFTTHANNDEEAKKNCKQLSDLKHVKVDYILSKK